MRRLALCGCVVSVALGVAVALLCALPVSAGADVFGPISLISEGALPGTLEAQQAEYAHDTTISGNGRYVAFDGAFHGVTGVWRAEVQGGKVGQIQQVAGGDAELPSISENGQYISFTTNEGASLPKVTYGPNGEAPEATEASQEAVNVYVRDMSIGRENPEAFKVASARNGSDEPLTYSGAETRRGAVAAGRSALGENSHGELEVAFVTTAVSDLLEGTPSEPKTPALQVAVRYVASQETKLVSEDPETHGPVPTREEQSELLGAVFLGTRRSFEPPTPYGYLKDFPPGASISADGTTVAWMGNDVNQQVTMLAKEARHARYVEPLWRRIAPGSETPTERVTGGSDPSNPACLASGETVLPSKPSSTDPCQGPFQVEEGNPSGGIWAAGGGEAGDPVPRLSADGYTVAFLSAAQLVTAGENFGRGAQGQPTDLYVADMHPGLTRDQALTQLTELAGGEAAGLGDIAPIIDFGISADGEQVAFATKRTQFPLGSPAFVSPPAGEPGLNELFDVDLSNRTLTRVTHGYQGPDEPSEHAHLPALAGEDPYQFHEGDGALSPSFSSDGGILAFSSTAYNLAFGDGNAPPPGGPPPGSDADGDDAFLVERTIFQPLPTPRYLSPAPQVVTQPVWQLGVTAFSRPDGSVLLYVRAPGAGTVRAGAHGVVPIRFTIPVHTARRRGGRSAGRRRVLTTKVASRSVTTAVQASVPSTGGLMALTLKLAPAYSGLASTRAGLSATVTVVFAATGHPTLQDSITVSFVRKARASRSRARSFKARRR